MEKAIWVTLLCLASASGEDGVIKYLTEERLKSFTGINALDDDWQTTVGVLEKFEKLNMVKRGDTEITILHFRERQESNLTGYERVKKYRKKSRNIINDNANDNAMITIDKRRVEKNRIDKEKEINKEKENRNCFNKNFESVESIIRKKKLL